MIETGNITAKGNVFAAKVVGHDKLTTSRKNIVVFFESVDDFANESVSEGHRRSICNAESYREGAMKLMSALGLSGTDVAIMTTRLLRGIIETPEDPYFWIKDLIAIGHDQYTRAAYEKLRAGLRKFKFQSDNPSLFEQFEMPSFEKLMNELCYGKAA